MTTPSRTPATLMRAVVQHRYGSADVLTTAEIAVPVPGRGQVLVQVDAAGVNRGTWHLMTGTPALVRLATGMRRPRQRVPGRDLAGRVVAAGPGVTRLRPGQRVFGIGAGTFAPFAVAREDKLSVVPDAVSMIDAASVAVSGSTALQALHEVGGVQAGQRVLVLGASGGVGSFAVQLARAAGAHVTGVASAAKADLVAALGADEVIDHATTDPTSGVQRYDLVLDIGGRRPLRHLRRALTPTGTLVLIGGEGGDRITGGLWRQLMAVALSRLVSQRLTMLLVAEQHTSTDRLAEAMQRGALHPSVGRTCPLERAADALRDLERGCARGKLVLVMKEDRR